MSHRVTLLAATSLLAVGFLAVPSVPVLARKGPSGETRAAASTTGTVVSRWVYRVARSSGGSPRAADINGDRFPEMILTMTGQKPVLHGVIDVLSHRGKRLPGWPVRTEWPMTTTAAIADLTGDGDVEIVANSTFRLFVFNSNATVESGWPKQQRSSFSPALADLDGDGMVEILFSADDPALYVYEPDGSTRSGWPVPSALEIGSPVVANLDADPELEIIAGTFTPSGPGPAEILGFDADGTPLSGFPIATSGGVHTPPAIADLDGDGELEIVATVQGLGGGSFDELAVWSAGGVPLPGWPAAGGLIAFAPPSVGDLDGDGDLEIVVPGAVLNPLIERVYAFHHDGAPVSGFPVDFPSPGFPTNPSSTAVIGDLDPSIPGAEILVNTTDWVFAVDGDGARLPGFPIENNDFGISSGRDPGPTLGDFDLDGYLDFIVPRNAGPVRMFSYVGSMTTDAEPDWPTFKQDARGTGAR